MGLEKHFEPCVSVLFSSLSGAQGGKGLVFALQESPGRYPLVANVLKMAGTLSVSGAATISRLISRL